MKLETYLKNHFQDVTVIGVVNPSIILNHNGNHYVIYRVFHKKHRFVLCKRLAALSDVELNNFIQC